MLTKLLNGKVMKKSMKYKGLTRLGLHYFRMYLAEGHIFIDNCNNVLA